MDAVTLFKAQAIATIATIEAETVPDMVVKDRVTKVPNPYLGRVKKVSRVNGIVGGWNYTNSVNNQRIRESNAQTVEEVEAVPEFEALPRAWGERLPKTGLVQYKENFYVEVKVQNSLETEYFIDGVPATPEQVEELKKYFPKKTEGARQQVEKPVILRDYAVENIKSVKMHGTLYRF